MPIPGTGQSPDGGIAHPWIPVEGAIQFEGLPSTFVRLSSRRSWMAVKIVSCTSDITPPVQKRAYQLKSVETRCWLDKCSRVSPFGSAGSFMYAPGRTSKKGPLIRTCSSRVGGSNRSARESRTRADARDPRCYGPTGASALTSVPPLWIEALAASASKMDGHHHSEPP